MVVTIAALSAILSAILWLASSFAWLWAVRIDPPLVKATVSAPNAIIMSDGPKGEISFGGTRMPNFAALDSYNKEVGFRNRVAAYISAAGAFFSAVAAIATAISMYSAP